MAKEVAQQTPGLVGLNPDNYQWDTVHAEAGFQVALDTIGDVFVAVYTGQETIDYTDKRTGESNSFVQLHFMAKNQSYDLNAGYDLTKAFKNIDPNTIVRIQLMQLVDTGQPSPLKSYRVDVAQGEANS